MNPTARYPESWFALALAPPRAHGAALGTATIRSVAEDFEVDEELSFVPDGEPGQWLLRIQKRGANTRWVAAELARHAKVHPTEVGYAGLKDRHALTVQWFSVPARTGTAEHWMKLQTTEFRVIEVRANARKLRRGALKGNRFRIRLRDLSVTQGEFEARLARMSALGVPNFFGPQRFGRGGFNLDRVNDWIRTGTAPPQRTSREFALSAARSLVFNAVLARRIEAGNWAQLLPGDVASLEGSASHFKIESIDDSLAERLRRFDVHPSGPLWGRGELASAGEPHQIETATAQSLEGVVHLLAREGLRQERRALRAAVHDLKVSFEANAAIVDFFLNRGQFATAVLREICVFGEPLPVEEFAE